MSYGSSNLSWAPAENAKDAMRTSPNAVANDAAA